MTTVHEDEPSGLLRCPRLGVIQAVVKNQKGARVDTAVSTTALLVLVSLALDDGLALDDILNNLGLVLVVNELGGNHVLEELVGDFRCRDDGADREVVLDVVEDVANQKGLASVLLADDDHHRTFLGINVASLLDHVDVELPKLEIHLLFIPYFCKLPQNERIKADNTEDHHDPHGDECIKGVHCSDDSTVTGSFRFRFRLPRGKTMVKDLRTTAVQLKLTRRPRLETSPWGLVNAQPFFPPLETLFKTETVSSLSEYGIKLAEEVDSVPDPTHIKTTKGRTVPIHRKTTMILSPFKWMRGDYSTLSLPKPEEIANEVHETLQSSNTAGYVGALTSIVLSESDCQHFPRVFGVYVGLADRHTIDISDDYEDLSERRWFGDNIGKTFELKLRTPVDTPEFSHTRGQRPGVILGDEIALDDVEDVPADHVSEPSSRSHEEDAESDSQDEDFEPEEEEEDDDEFDIRSCDCESEEDEDDEEPEEEDDEPYAWATFRNAPVITTVMEECAGTFYTLLEEYPAPEKHVAWVAQIVFALAYAQRNYGFTHNDLHGDNVMYVPTTHEFLYYKHNGTCYRLPTYGVLIKIIDFDRAITSVRLMGMKEPRQFMSSQFRPGDEAAGQYNMDPFKIQERPYIAPNPSFDLCRFATSTYWSLPDEHPLRSVFREWMTQSDGTSVLLRAGKDDEHERYHGFDLYKAIARYCKDSATPRRELAKLTMFQIPSVPLGASCLFVES